ncbi:MAG: hypothetical protein RIR01_2332 [Bacteroidota bacterium]|jgi:hypothetical protein
MSTGACFNMRGNLCTVNSFDDRMKYKDSPYKPDNAEMLFISEQPVINHEKVEDIDNPDKYEWYEIGGEKYGRTMYCPKSNIRRTLTFAEFYQSSTVD